jgi:hypothetical protein
MQQRGPHNPIQYTRRFRQYSVVPETQHQEAPFVQERVARCVAIQHLCMLGSVNLDDQSLLEADEIDNIGADRLLAAEFPAS